MPTNIGKVFKFKAVAVNNNKNGNNNKQQKIGKAFELKAVAVNNKQLRWENVENRVVQVPEGDGTDTLQVACEEVHSEADQEMDEVFYGYGPSVPDLDDDDDNTFYYEDLEEALGVEKPTELDPAILARALLDTGGPLPEGSHASSSDSDSEDYYAASIPKTRKTVPKEEEESDVSYSEGDAVGIGAGCVALGGIMLLAAAALLVFNLPPQSLPPAIGAKSLPPAIEAKSLPPAIGAKSLPPASEPRWKRFRVSFSDRLSG
eukprot:gene7138-244_t